MKNRINLLGILIFFVIILLTIGYSVFSDQLTIAESVSFVRFDANVRITSVTSNSGNVSNLNFTVSSITNVLTVPVNGSVTYNVSIRNLGNVPMAVSGVTFTMNGQTVSGLSANIDNTNYEKICNNNNVCTISALKTFNLTITNNSGSAINGDIDVNLIYTPVYTITYNNEVIGEVLDGNSFTYTFVNNIPTSVTKVSGNGNLNTSNLPTINISSITSNIVLTGEAASSGTGTIDDPYINTDNEYDITDLDDGYTLFTDAPGAPEVSAVTVTEGGQDVTQITSFVYTDTGSDGVPYGNGQNDNPVLDTGVFVMNGTAFSIHIKFKANLKANQEKYILSAISKVSSTIYSGFTLRVQDGSTAMLQVASHVGKTYSGNVLNSSQQKTLNTSADANSNTENIYEITMVYTPGGGQPFVTTCTGSNCASTSGQTLQKKNIPTNLTNTIITIGGDGISNVNDINSMKVLELEICKGAFGTNYSCNVS